MIELHDVASIRAAEEIEFGRTAEGVLMQRASFALSVTCAELLHLVAGSVVGTQVVLLVGKGNNGGDALWAGAMLAARGVRVTAVQLAKGLHEAGAASLRRAGGRLIAWDDDGHAAVAALADADLVLDGIVGIGGSGGLHADAQDAVAYAESSGALIVAIDVPSGVNADTGEVSGPAVTADITVTFGAVKPGLAVSPGRLHAGEVVRVDIGLTELDAPVAFMIEDADVATWVTEPGPDAYKYRRGVVGVCAGSARYPGAALLTAGSARRGNVGMVRYLDRSDGVARSVVEQFPDTVIDGSDPADQERADAWVCGPGVVGDASDAATVQAVLGARRPVILDAGALTVLADNEHLRSQLRDRASDGFATVITPHEGEFARLFPNFLTRGRLTAAVAAAEESGAVVVLKGPGTIIAGPDGLTFVDDEGTSDLSCAGSGDVLSGLIGAVLAGAWAQGLRSDVEEPVAAAVWLHGVAGRAAARRGPIVATDLIAAIPDAIRAARFGDRS